MIRKIRAWWNDRRMRLESEEHARGYAWALQGLQHGFTHAEIHELLWQEQRYSAFDKGAAAALADDLLNTNY